ncbi:hypothetical protein M758_9G066000 [Ceratodon purpureus]|nr:hypothetical protein M758_9G066000 [Ceratodon purpureus]
MVATKETSNPQLRPSMMPKDDQQICSAPGTDELVPLVNAHQNPPLSSKAFKQSSTCSTDSSFSFQNAKYMTSNACVLGICSSRSWQV